MVELARAVRRSILLTLLLAVGGLAAALPTLLGEPESEHPALRGLAALVLAFLAAVFLAARWGRRGPLEPEVHLLELAQVATAISALLLPAFFAGMTTGEAETLMTLAQTAVGWKNTVASATLTLLLFVAAYVFSRLRSSVKEIRLRGGGLVAGAAGVCLALVVVSAGRLLLIPAMSAIELLEKAILLLVLWTLGVAALLPGQGAGRSLDLRTVALAVGLVGVGLVTSLGTYLYLRPSVGDIERVRFTRGDGSETTFAALLDGRPDIYGIFALEYASATPRLAFVRSLDETGDDLLERVHRTRLGTARLVPQPPQNKRESRVPPLEASFEVWIRLRWWPWTDLRPGLWIGEPVFDWEVAPSAHLAVATTYEGSPDTWKTRRSSEVDQGAYEVRIWRGGGRSQKLLGDLAQAPRILELTDSSVRLLGTANSPEARPGRFAASDAPTPPNWLPQLAATTCNLETSTCEPWQTGARGASRLSHPADRILEQNSVGWSVFDTRTLATVLRSPRHAPCVSDCDRGYLLRDGRVIRLLQLGRMPDWDARLSSVDAKGKETVVTSIGNVRLFRFAGELDDGTVAIAWRTQYAWSRTQPVFGWTLDAWNPRTGERRRLADDVATFPAADNDASTIFLDRRGRLVAPAVDGLRELAVLNSSRTAQEQW